MKFTEVIADTLSKCDPANETRYEEGKEAYLKELEALHEGFLEVSKNRRRNMIVVGDKFPFRYLAEEYGFDYRAAFSGCSTDTEPSAKTIAYLIDKARTEEIPVVYYLGALQSPGIRDHRRRDRSENGASSFLPQCDESRI